MVALMDRWPGLHDMACSTHTPNAGPDEGDVDAGILG